VAGLSENQYNQVLFYTKKQVLICLDTFLRLYKDLSLPQIGLLEDPLNNYVMDSCLARRDLDAYLEVLNLNKTIC
jgi:hypothetical protein